MMLDMLDPKNDLVFKLMYTRGQSLRPLQSLLTAVLVPPEPITALEILNPEIPKHIINDRALFLDIHVKLANGEHVNVEIQMATHRSQWPRMHLHWSRLFSQQMQSGDQFASLRPSTVIFFNKYGVLESTTEDYHYSFRIREIMQRVNVPDYLKLELIEMHRVLNLPIEPQGSDKDHGLLDWIRYLWDPNNRLWRAKIMSNPDIAEADEMLRKLSEDRATRELARQRELGEFDFKMSNFEAREEGKAEGKSQALKEAAKNMKQQGLAVTDIAKLLGISLSDVNLLLDP